MFYELGEVHPSWVDYWIHLGIGEEGGGVIHCVGFELTGDSFSSNYDDR